MERSNEFMSKFNNTLDLDIKNLEQEINYKNLLLNTIKKITYLISSLKTKTDNINKLIDKKEFEKAYKLVEEIRQGFGQYNTEEIKYYDKWLKENKIEDTSKYTKEELDRIEKYQDYNYYNF